MLVMFFLCCIASVQFVSNLTYYLDLCLIKLLFLNCELACLFSWSQTNPS